MKKEVRSQSGTDAHNAESGVRRSERGFALLLVFLMAAVVGLYLYTQLPRVAFESEREKEQMLIDRGEQYKRAIQLYVAALKKYPQRIEDLEDTNDKRYLRQRYIDPMTGKDEWRLIHVNAAGQLTDSLVQKPPCGAMPGNPGAPTGGALGAASMTSSMTPSSGMSSSTGTTGNGAAGDCTPSGAATGALASGSTASGTAGAANGQNEVNGAAPTNPNDVNAAVRKRPSDVVGQAYTAPVNVDPNDPSTWAPITLAPATPSGQPTGQPPSGAVGFNGGLLGQTPTGVAVMNGQPVQPGQVGVPGTGGAFPLPGQPGFNPTQNQFKIDANGQLVPVTPGMPGQTAPANNANGQVGQQAAGPYVPAPVPGQPVGPSPFGQQPTGAANAVNPTTGVAPFNAATSAITSMLTNPNPTAGMLGSSAGMTQGGIAGVASNFKGPSIKIYGTRQKYQEWEFIFSMNNQQGGGNGQPQNALGGAPQGGTTPAGQNGSTTTPPTGANPSSGANPPSIFGN